MFNSLKNKITEIIHNNEQENIDYVGINIDENNNLKYKIYYFDYCKSNNNIDKYSNYLLNKLINNQLVNESGPVDDNGLGRFRCDLKIKGVNDKEMIEIIDILSEETFLSKNNIDEIIKLSQMKVLDIPNTKYAALYYLGFIIEDDIIKALKLHFMTRTEQKYQASYNNEYYKEYLRKLNIKEINNLLDKSKSILLDKTGNLYLIGVDYYQNDIKKYKVYFHFDYYKVRDIIKYINNRTIQNELSKIDEFVEEIGHLKFCILAFCIDTNNKFSLNLYFKLKQEGVTNV